MSDPRKPLGSDDQTESTNPFAAPMSEPIYPTASRTAQSKYVACPKCGDKSAELVGFSWWGGILGPRLLNHVKCGRCLHQYNGKSGGSNTLGITIYVGLGFLFALGVFSLLYLL
ncbi:MAG: hypothetical protein AAFN77_14600 [Planctomycetota bacterium]